MATINSATDRSAFSAAARCQIAQISRPNQAVLSASTSSNGCVLPQPAAARLRLVEQFRRRGLVKPILHWSSGDFANRN